MYFSEYWLRGQELRPVLWHRTIVFLVLAAACLKGCHDRPQIMLEHGNIACSWATPFRQLIRKQAAADLQPGFLLNLLYQYRADFDRSHPDKNDGTVIGQYFVICDHFGATSCKQNRL